MLRRLLQDKRTVLFIYLLGVIALTLLAAALDELTFKPAQPINLFQSAGADAPSAMGGDAIISIPFWKQIGLVLTLILIAALIISLLSPEGRKRLTFALLRSAAIILTVAYVIQKNPDLLQRLMPQFEVPNMTVDPALSGTGALPPPVFDPPQVPGFLSFAITFALMLFFAGTAWAGYAWLRRQNELLDTPNPFENIKKAARVSLGELSAPGASGDAIIRCYENMSKAVDQRRGLHRGYSMTAAEFAERLKNSGLPEEPVTRLTRLFESARYGARQATQREIDEAVLCLTSILAFCGETV